ncbi:hypothetical protein O181_003348 [Austropuccinia psidii MF-1]|uniref:Uncharacterized protein n=1 Tax=Austropuccinia psidii MF-1 TaxID=1389203 RepID=A0A9Q3BEI5_9BASI|nr:hypothetical protein [Austropuccinia psidii MF-1]
MTPDLEEEGPMESTSSKPVPEVSKYKPKGPQKKQRGFKNNQGNKCRPYPQGYRIPKLEPAAMDSVFNIARTLIEFTAKKQKPRDREALEKHIQELIKTCCTNKGRP